MSCHNPRQMHCLHCLACRALVITAHSVMIAGLRSLKRMCFLHGCEIVFLHLESIGRSHIRGIHTWPEWGCVQPWGNARSATQQQGAQLSDQCGLSACHWLRCSFSMEPCPTASNSEESHLPYIMCACSSSRFTGNLSH